MVEMVLCEYPNAAIKRFTVPLSGDIASAREHRSRQLSAIVDAKWPQPTCRLGNATLSIMESMNVTRI